MAKVSDSMAQATCQIQPPLGRGDHSWEDGFNKEKLKMPKTKKVANNFGALAKHFNTRQILELADKLAQEGEEWVTSTRHALLRQAAAKGNVVDIDGLVARGYDLATDTRPSLGQTVVHVAAQHGNNEVLEHLLSHYKIHPKTPANSGAQCSAMRMAIDELQPKAIALLLEHGDQLNGAMPYLFVSTGRLLVKHSGNRATSELVLSSMIRCMNALVEGGENNHEPLTHNKTIEHLFSDVIFRHPWCWSKVIGKLKQWSIDLGDEGNMEIIEKAFIGSAPAIGGATEILQQLRVEHDQISMDRNTAAPGRSNRQTPRL